MDAVGVASSAVLRNSTTVEDSHSTVSKSAPIAPFTRLIVRPSRWRGKNRGAYEIAHGSHKLRAPDPDRGQPATLRSLSPSQSSSESCSGHGNPGKVSQAKCHQPHEVGGPACATETLIGAHLTTVKVTTVSQEL